MKYYARIKTYTYGNDGGLENDTWLDSGPYLTAEKMYPIIEWVTKGRSFRIATDNGEVSFCLITDCAHLGGGEWEIIEVEDV